MSAYSDWKSGVLSDKEYEKERRREIQKARLDALRSEGAFLDQYHYGRSMDGEYYKDND